MNPQSRQTLRARAHRLHPVVSISQKGLSPTVLAEIDAALIAHELIKIRVYGADRDERASLLTEICKRAPAEPVQQIGNVLIIFRERPQRNEAAQTKVRKPSRKVAPRRAPTGRSVRTGRSSRSLNPRSGK